MTETQEAVEQSNDSAFDAALTSRHPSVTGVAKYFHVDHLRDGLHADVAREFQAFTLHVLGMVQTDSPELTVALRKLLEAKDAAVRAALES